MTERAAWRLIAERRIDRPGRYARHGLCFQIVELRDEGRIPTRLAKWMLARIMVHIEDGHLHAYRRSVPRRDADAGRALAALWLAVSA